jgi:hypothetical protein
MALGIAGLYVASALADIASGGSLDPPGPIGSTMKTLNDIPGTWSQKLIGTGSDPCNTPRFTCVLDTEGVRDNETGLVWEATPFTELVNWSTAVQRCGNSLVGGRGGWRLPTDAELRSLLDPNASGTPLLPDGHPFNAFGSLEHFWTVSPVPLEADLVYAVDVDTLDRYQAAKSELLKRWCVRGVQADTPEDSPLAEEPPAWYQRLDATGGCFSERFRCVMNGEGVLDRETGLVWWRDANETGGNFEGQAVLCGQGTHGNRKGWRLPTTPELMTLIDPAQADPTPGAPPAFPPGHPFDVQLGYWTWTTEEFSSGEHVAVHMSVGVTNYQTPGVTGAFAMCVRGASEGAFP